MRDPLLSPALFSILSSLVEERTGIHYDRQGTELFSSKLMARALDAGFESALDYYYFLRYDDPDRREFDALIDSLVVNETYFFREVSPLRVLCDDVLGPAIRRGKRPRIWCAASSTGEEPLTMAMLLAERGLLEGAEIVGSDISPRALARAKEGLYGERSLRSTPVDARARWFEESGQKFVVHREIRDAVSFRRVNLMDVLAVGALGRFDVILCRNVLIYFSESSVAEVAATLATSLEDGGRLLVGASESLLRFGTMLSVEERGGSFFYRKVES